MTEKDTYKKLLKQGLIWNSTYEKLLEQWHDKQQAKFDADKDTLKKKLRKVS